MLTLLLLAAAPALPAPFEKLEPICLNPRCSLVVYATKGALTAPKKEVEGEEAVALGVISFGTGKKRCVQFSMGPSEDPQLIISPEAACKPGSTIDSEFIIGGEQFIVPGTNVLYAMGSSNAKFNVRQKFVLGDKGWKPAPQPFFYVGEKVKVPTKNSMNEPVTSVPLLAERKVGAEVVVNVAPGQTVEILVADPDPSAKWFLVRTELGLVGWFSSPDSSVMPDVLGLSYHGD